MSIVPFTPLHSSLLEPSLPVAKSVLGSSFSSSIVSASEISEIAFKWFVFFSSKAVIWATGEDYRPRRPHPERERQEEEQKPRRHDVGAQTDLSKPDTLIDSSSPDRTTYILGPNSNGIYASKISKGFSDHEEECAICRESLSISQESSVSLSEQKVGCELAHRDVSVQTPNYQKDLVLLKCGHLFHMACLQLSEEHNPQEPTCSVCRAPFARLSSDWARILDNHPAGTGVEILSDLLKDYPTLHEIIDSIIRFAMRFKKWDLLDFLVRHEAVPIEKKHLIFMLAANQGRFDLANRIFSDSSFSRPIKLGVLEFALVARENATLECFLNSTDELQALHPIELELVVRMALQAALKCDNLEAFSQIARKAIELEVSTQEILRAATRVGKRGVAENFLKQMSPDAT